MRQILFAVTAMFAGFAQAQSNVLPVQVMKVGQTLNMPMVTVTICVPGTTNCQTIDHILLDSASNGLRFVRSKVQLNLPVAQTADGKTVAECMAFSAGGWWGPLAYADVTLGGEHAAHVPIQYNQEKFAVDVNGAADCGMLDSPDYNGILGVSDAISDCEGESCRVANVGTYYSACDTKGCSKIEMPVANQVANPVRLFPTDNNGLLFHFAQIPSEGVKVATGEVIFGIGTQANNQPKDMTALSTDKLGFMQFEFDGQTYGGLIDTGTEKYEIPTLPQAAIDTCDEGSFVCPKTVTQLPAYLVSQDGKTKKQFQMQAWDEEALMANGNSVYNDLIYDAEQRWFVAGMPFFFGKTVAFGFDGKQSPLGNGPLIGFSEDPK